MDTVSSQFDVDMELFTDAEHTTALNAEHQVNVPDPIYANVGLVGVEDNLVLQIKKCTATPTEDGSGDVVYTFIDNYAALEADNMALEQNCAASSASFWINSFAFVNADEATQSDVYLHCEVHVCDSDNDEGGCACPTGDGSATTRRRRSVDAVEKPNATLRVGPISVKNSHNF